MVTAVSRQLIDGQWQEGSSHDVLVDRNPYGSVIRSVNRGRRQFPY
jgi:hypothetical protein